MDFNPKTFCAAPWFQIRNEQFGEYKVCAVIDSSKSKFTGITTHCWPMHGPEEFLQSDYSQYLREQLTSGNALPECHRCWSQECAGSKSQRQKINDTLTNNNLSQSWIMPYVKNKQNYQQDLIMLADVKLTNTCNFSCAMCYPGDSSQIYTAWLRDRDHPVIQNLLSNQPNLLQLVRENYKDQNNYRLLKLLLSKRPRRIKILGGEPLLDRTAITILQNIPAEDKKKITLSFVTNGSVDLVVTDQLLTGYRDINYVVSIDGIGARQDYIRRGSNWNNVANNIEKWIETNPGKRLDFHTTVQAMNVAGISELENWAADRSIVVGFGVLDQPDFLSFSAIPPKLKSSLNTNQEISNLLDAATFDPALLPKLKDFLAWYDPDQTWQQVLPEWISVL
jgi:organic radical activating enzyme